MGHLVQAAHQLVEEVAAIDSKAAVTILPEVDSLGFNRSIRVEGDIAKSLGAVLDAGADPRIAEVVKSPKGVRVEFVATTAADFRDPFDLAEGIATLDED